MQPAILPLHLLKGATLTDTLRFTEAPFSWRSIEQILPTSPVRLVVPGHGFSVDWPVWVEGVIGLAKLNRDKDSTRPLVARPIDEKTLEINAIDGAGTSARGGSLVFKAPYDLSGARGRLVIRQTPASDLVLLELTTENGGLSIDGPGVVHRRIEADAVPDLTRAFYHLDFLFPDKTVRRFMEGEVTASWESLR